MLGPSVLGGLSVLGASRSPFVARHGALAPCHPVDLVAEVLVDVIERSQISPDRIGQVLVCTDTPVGAQSLNMARSAVLAAGWPDTLPAVTLDAQGTGSMWALQLLAESQPEQPVVVAAVDVTSIVPPGAATVRDYGTAFGPRVSDRLGGIQTPGEIVDAVAKTHGVTRERANSEAVRQIQLDPLDSQLVSINLGRTRVEHDTVVVAHELSSDPLFADDGIGTALNTAGWADGAAAIVVAGAHHTPRAGLIASVAVAAGSALDPVDSLAHAISSVGWDPTNEGLALAEPSAAVQLATVRELARQHAEDPTMAISRWLSRRGVLGTGSAPAADGLRLVVDTVHRKEPVVVASTGGLGQAGACRLTKGPEAELA